MSNHRLVEKGNEFKYISQRITMVYSILKHRQPSITINGNFLANSFESHTLRLDHRLTVSIFLDNDRTKGLRIKQVATSIS